MPNPNDMVECPYDKCHRLLRKRLQTHLTKCKKNHPDVELQTCPFNKTHLVREEDYVNHVTNCRDAAMITQNSTGAIMKEDPEEVKHNPITCDEDWDDVKVQDYNPLKHANVNALKRRPVDFIPDGREQLAKRQEIEKSEETNKIQNLSSEEASGSKKVKREGDLFDNDSRVDRANNERFRMRSRSRSHSRSRSSERIFYRDRVTPSPPPPPIISNDINWLQRRKTSPPKSSY